MPCAYNLNRSIQGCSEGPASFFRNVPRSKMLKFPFAPSNRSPRPSVWSTRLARFCSKDTYKPRIPSRAFACSTWYVKDVFIVPGAPETRTM